MHAMSSGIWSYALPRVSVEGGNFLERSFVSYRLNGFPALMHSPHLTRA